MHFDVKNSTLDQELKIWQGGGGKIDKGQLNLKVSLLDAYKKLIKKSPKWMKIYNFDFFPSFSLDIWLEYQF